MFEATMTRSKAVIDRHVIEAHSFTDAGELARRDSHYDTAIGFGRSAWRMVEQDDSPAAVKAFVKGTRVESWGGR